VIDAHFVLVGVLVQLIGGLAYVVDTLKGKTRPNKVTWLMWAVAPLVAFAAELSEGAGIQSLATFITGFVPLLVFGASFVNRHSGWALTRFDFFCGALSLLGLGLWYVTRDGNIAIVFAIFADEAAAIPTLLKSYRDPQSENDLVYSLGLVNAGIAVLAAPEWDFKYLGFPVYLFGMQVVLVALIRFELGLRIRPGQQNRRGREVVPAQQK